MGNICCRQEEEQKNNRTPNRTPVKRHSSFQLKTKSEQNLIFEEQKTLLHDFHQAVKYLKLNGKDNDANKFISFCLHEKISEDEVSSRHAGTLTDQNQMAFKCVVKVIAKHKVQVSPLPKRNLAIECLITRFLGHPFIETSLHFHEDQEYFYLIFDRGRQKPLQDFSKTSEETELKEFFLEDFENKLRFIIAGVILGIEKLHSLGIVYRGINLENIVITENGYPLLTNLSRLHPQGQGDASPAACHFTSPQQFRGQLVTKATDCWALGVLIYFLTKGVFINYSTFNEKEFKGQGTSDALEDLVNKLLIYSPDNRLGSKGIGSVKRHKFFKDFNWEKYQQTSLESPLANWKSKSKSIEQTAHNESDNYYDLGRDELSMLGFTLCIDFVTLSLISKVLDDEASKEKPNVFQDEETPGVDEHQLATQIDIGVQGEEEFSD